MSLQNIRTAMAQNGIDGFLCTNASNRRYLSGFTGSSGMLLITQTRNLLLTDGRYALQAAKQAADWECILYEAGQDVSTLQSVAQSMGICRMGFEADDVSVARHTTHLHAMLGMQWQDISGILALQRAIKKKSELNSIRRAAAICDAVFEEMTGLLRPGISERDLAMEIDYAVVRRGAQSIAFPTIVSFGPNTAMPHALPSRRLLRVGDPILMDFGAVIDGYCSDMTRVLFMGSVDNLQRRVYNTVIGAADAAQEMLRVGTPCREVDAAARQVIQKAGWGDCFVHGTGHGVGLDIHELPTLNPSSTEVLSRGMVVTIEPGIYLEGQFGIRLEDLFYVDDSPINLCAADKMLVIL